MNDQDRLRTGVAEFCQRNPDAIVEELVAYISQKHVFCGIECPADGVIVVRFCCAQEPEVRFDLTKTAGPT